MDATEDKTREVGVAASAVRWLRDPTENVIALVKADKERGDDLRALQSLYIQSEIGRLGEIVRRVEETSSIRAKHSREVSIIHQGHDREIHKMEQEKLAAFRASDEAARLTEANRQLAAIEVLARTTQTNADNLRNALDATASTIAKQNAETNSEIYQRLAALEKSSYEGAGKQAVADPMMEKLVNKIETLVTSRDAVSGEKTGKTSQQQLITWIIMTILALLAIAPYVRKG